MRTTPVIIFYSYAWQDRMFRDTLENHLSPLRQQGVIACWDQSLVGPGADRRQAIAEHMNAALIILLLISADYLASSVCQREMQHALQRQLQRSAYVILILVRPSAWQETPLVGLRCLPRDRRAITVWGGEQQDAAFAEIVSGVRQVVSSLLLTSPVGPLPPLPAWPLLRPSGCTLAPGPPALSSGAMEERPVRRGRAILLGRVQRRIGQFKAGNLLDSVLLRPGLQEQQSHPLWPALLQTGPTQHLSSLAISIEDAYNRAEDAGGLLLLGEPGAGKTTHLYQLAEHLVAEAIAGEERQVPVVFNLSSWGRTRQPLALWLAAELHSDYQIPLDIATFWICHQQVLPLLDGLEEVDGKSREACVDAIAAYCKAYGLLPLVLACRSQDYQALAHPPVFPSHLVIEPLTDAQVASYVASAGPAWAALSRMLQEQSELRQFARTPLFLPMLLTVYQPVSPASEVFHGSLVDRRQQLFALYVEDRLCKQRALLAFAGEQMKHWLSWLAHRLYLHRRSVFYVEHLQPSWLSNRRMADLYDLLAVRLPGILIGTLVSIVVATFFGLLNPSTVTDPSVWSKSILPGSLLGWLLSSRTLPQRHVRRPVPHPTWQRAGIWLLVGGLLGVLVAMSAWFSDRAGGDPGAALVDGLINGGTFGAAYFLVPFWLSTRRASVRPAQTQGRQRFFQRIEVRDGLVDGVIFALCGGVAAFLRVVQGTRIDTPVPLSLSSEVHFQVGTALAGRLSLGLTSALLEGLIFGVIAAILSRLLTSLDPGILPVDRLCWSWGSLGRCLFSHRHLALAASFLTMGWR